MVDYDDFDNDDYTDGNENSDTQELPCKKKNQVIPRAYNMRTPHALYTHVRQQ